MEGNSLSTAIQSVISSLTTAFTTSDLITIVTACVGAVAGYVVLWFGKNASMYSMRNTCCAVCG